MRCCYSRRNDRGKGIATPTRTAKKKNKNHIWIIPHTSQLYNTRLHTQHWSCEKKLSVRICFNERVRDIFQSWKNERKKRRKKISRDIQSIQRELERRTCWKKKVIYILYKRPVSVVCGDRSGLFPIEFTRLHPLRGNPCVCAGASLFVVLQHRRSID